ncbi:hypothetical protein BBJ28_00010682 [Nothophytophthora sp. Chile5]|nr:hypothetical protein BBJ28_00010682 [Nothophytophthora sp. Chile5]
MGTVESEGVTCKQRLTCFCILGRATFTLRDVDASSVEQARKLHTNDFEQFKWFHNFFTAREETMPREIDAKYTDKRELIDNWVRESIGSDVQTCLKQNKETKDALLVLLMVSAALAKHGKQALDAKDALGEMDDLVSTRFRTYGLRSRKQQKHRKNSRSKHKSKKQVAHTVGLDFVSKLNLSLPAENRVGDEKLTEILHLSGNMRMVLTTTNQGIHKRVDKALVSSSTPGKRGKWTKKEFNRLVQIIKVTQAERFQSAMIDAGGDHLYDAIRHRLKQVGKQAGRSLWDDEKDKPTLRRKSIWAGEAYAADVKSEMDAQCRKERHINSNGNKTYVSSKGDGHILFTGPRGGRYFINSNGNRTYVSNKGRYRLLFTGPRGGHYYINVNGNRTYVK